MDDEILQQIFNMVKKEASTTSAPVSKSKPEKKPRKPREMSDDEREIVRERLRVNREKGFETRRTNAAERAKLKEQAKTQKIETYKEKLGLKPTKVETPKAESLDLASIKEQIKRELLEEQKRSMESKSVEPKEPKCLEPVKSEPEVPKPAPAPAPKEEVRYLEPAKVVPETSGPSPQRLKQLNQLSKYLIKRK